MRCVFPIYRCGRYPRETQCRSEGTVPNRDSEGGGTGRGAAISLLRWVWVCLVVPVSRCVCGMEGLKGGPDVNTPPHTVINPDHTHTRECTSELVRRDPTTWEDVRHARMPNVARIGKEEKIETKNTHDAMEKNQTKRTKRTGWKNALDHDRTKPDAT